MDAPYQPPYELEIVSEEEIGRGGFLSIRRLHLHNLRPDGTRSRRWLCDFIERPKGVDAVVLVLWRRGTSGIEVLLRRGLRPAVLVGRPAERVPLPDGRTHGFITELVAGIIEEGEVGEAAIRRRAIEEAWEEAGLHLVLEALELLGPGMFPSPGMTAEKFWFAVAEVPTDATGHPPAGDGSPMEEDAEVRWVGLEEALGLCETGAIEDAKTELGLWRLARRLARTANVPTGAGPR
jgi:ADP-ribose pyrophosphatase